MREGRGSLSQTQFYKKNHRWTEGLISAAKAVVPSTNRLIETADGVISGGNLPEQLIVASNDVAASTAQLVAASRVKVSFMSKTQDRLETASKAVTAACRSLVRQVQEIIAQKNRDEGEVIDYSKMGDNEFKVKQMDQQVCYESSFQALQHVLTVTLRSKSSSLRMPWPRLGRDLVRCASCLISKSKRVGVRGDEEIIALQFSTGVFICEVLKAVPGPFVLFTEAGGCSAWYDTILYFGPKIFLTLSM